MCDISITFIIILEINKISIIHRRNNENQLSKCIHLFFFFLFNSDWFTNRHLTSKLFLLCMYYTHIHPHKRRLKRKATKANIIIDFTLISIFILPNLCAVDVLTSACKKIHMYLILIGQS